MTSTSRLARLALVLLCLMAGQPALATEVVVVLPREAQGLSGHLRAASLSVQTAARPDATPQDILAAARADYARLVGALYEVGRYGGIVSVRVDGREVAEMSPFAAPARIGRVELRVEPGPLFGFGDVRLGPLAPGTRLPAALRPGAPAYSGVLGEATRTATERWREAGHAKVAIASQRVTADHRAARLSAEITLAPGPRLRFGELIPQGQSRVRPERIRAIAGLPSGEVYHPRTLERAAERLRDTGAFQSVVMEEAAEIRAGDRLDIIARVADAKRRRIGFGAELSSFEGLTLSGFWMHRNLLGGAERLRIDAEVRGIGGNSGGLDYVLSTRFERPATFTPDTDLILDARAQELDEPGYRERSLRFGVGLEHRFDDRLSGEIGLDYQYSEIDDGLGSRSLEHVFLPVGLTRDTRDDKLDATRGTYFGVELTPFVGLDNGALGGRALLDARSYTRLLGRKGLVFATRGQIGTILGAGLAELPPAMMFFSGGAGTVRGQSYQSLGVLVAPGVKVGGRSFAAVSAELRATVRGPWSVVAFADAGFVGRNSDWDDPGNTHAGGGLGVRYDTGLGPIRLDLATPLDSDAGRDFELYIGIGQAF